MRVTLLALGSRGDVQPMAHLARGLTEAGHPATVVALAEYADLVTAIAPKTHFQPVHGSIADALSRSRISDALGRSLPGQFVLLKRWTSSLASDFADAVLDVTEPGDTVITGVLTRGVATTLTAGRDCRMATVVYTGQYPTLHRDSFFAPQYFTGWRHYDSWGTNLSWTLATSLGSAPTHEVARRLGLPRTSSARITRLADRHPTLVAASPLLVPPAPDWPRNVFQIGYLAAPMQNDPSANDTADAAPTNRQLADFLQREPVYIGFGSFTQFTAEQETAAIVQAAELTQRPIVTLTKPGQPSGFLSNNVFATAPVPFEWLFPRVAATIHHGGSGTSHEALRSGRPTAVVPFGADQPYHGARLHSLGVGPAPLPVRKLTADTLARLIDGLTTSPQSAGYAKRARAVADQARGEDGVGDALAALEQQHLLPTNS